MRRRYFLSSTAALGAAAVTPAFGQQKPVFLHYTQEQLDQAYDQAVWEPQLNELQAYDSTSSAAVRKVLPPRTERYGKSDIELIDIFTPANPSGVPIMVYIHGGAWLYNSRLDASFPAPTLVGRGAAYLTPDFNDVKQARLPDRIEQCRSAVEWAVRNAASRASRCRPTRMHAAPATSTSGSRSDAMPMNFEFPWKDLPAVMRGPRVERRRVLIGGSAFWGTLVESGAEAGQLRLDDGRLLDAEAQTCLPPVSPSKIIAVHISYSSRSIETRNKQFNRMIERIESGWPRPAVLRAR